MMEGIQNNFFADNIVAQTPVAGPDAPLALAKFYVGQLFDVVSPCLVVRVLFQNIKYMLGLRQNFRISPGDAADIPFVERRRNGMKTRRHILNGLYFSGFLGQLAPQLG